MKIVYHYANGRFDWLVSGQQSDDPSRESISILYGKYERFSFVHPVTESNFQDRHLLINDSFHNYQQSLQFPYFDEQNFNR